MEPIPPALVLKLDAALWEKNRRKLVRTNAFMVLAPVAIVVAVDAWIHQGFIWRQNGGLAATEALLLLLICAVGWFFARKRIDRAEKRYHSFELTLTPDGLVRRQCDVPELRVPFSEIGDVQVIEGKGTMMGMRSSSQFLWIADELIDYERVCALIRQHARKYVQLKQPPWWLRNEILLPTSILSILVIMINPNLIVVLAATPVFLATLASDWIKLARGLGVSKAQKRNLWLTPLFLLIVVLRIFYLFSLR